MNWITDIRRGTHLAALVLTLTVFSPLPARAGINRWTSSGPDVAGVSCVAIDPMHFAVVYAGTQRGVFKSSDGGASWSDPSSGKLDGINIHSLAIDPLTPSSIYVGTSSGVLKSADGGASWNNRLIASAIYNLIFGSQKSTIYAADFDDVGAYYYPGPSVVYKSTDDGETWSRSPSGFSIVPGTLLINPTQPSIVYATSYDRDGVQKSVDAGSTWSMASGDLAGYFVNALAIDARHPTTLYAETYRGIFKSVDASSTWRLASSDLNISHWGVSALAIDPRDSNTLYAGTYSRGVFRSTDGGATWGPFNEGLSNLVVTALAIDRTGTLLHAATASGVFDIQIAPVIYPCDPAPDHLCSLSLMSGRFQISVSASDADKGVLAIGQAVPQGDEFGYFSLPQLTGDSALPEVVVKMADATSLSPDGGWFWVFYSALTSLPYEITVTDTATGQVRTYWSEGFCGGADTSAFPGGAAAGAKKESTVRTTLSASGDTLSLLGNRFQATLTATNPRDGTTAPGAAIPQGDRFGYFSLPAFTGNPNFPEVFVKMIDATSLPGGDFRLFHTGLTDLRYTLTVTDSVTGAVKTYQNDPSDPTRLCGGADTAFSMTPTAPPDASLAGDWTGTFVTADDLDCDSYATPAQASFEQVGSTVIGVLDTLQGPCGFTNVAFRGTLQETHSQEPSPGTARAGINRWTNRGLDGLAIQSLAIVTGEDVVLDWNRTALATQSATGDARTPPNSRALAMVHAAIYDAVNAIDRQHTVYAVDVQPAPGSSPEAAAAAAAHAVLIALYPSQQANLDLAYAASLSGIPDGAPKSDGISLGEFVAAEILALRASDGSTTVLPYTQAPGPGIWQPTPPAFAPAVFVAWGGVNPFTLRSGSQFRAEGPPALDGSEYASDFDRVKRLGAANSSDRSPEQTQIARFWLENSQITWNNVARSVAAARHNSLLENARLFALLNLAAADTAIAVFDSKYAYNFWRPVTAIRAADTDGNDNTVADPTWTPLVATPAHPDYTSQHSAFGGAASEILASFFGTDEIAFDLTTSTAPGGVVRSYDSFSQAADENMRSRIYVGFHFPAACRNGLNQGIQVGRWVFRKFLQPLKHAGN